MLDLRQLPVRLDLAAAESGLGFALRALRANGIAVHPNGRQVYVSNGGDANVSVIDTATNQVATTIPVGQRPWNMALTPDGKKLYVANGRSHNVSVIDTATRTKLRDVAVGKLPWGVVIR